MSELTRLVLVRHGQTAYSVERRWSGHNEQPLSDEGRVMAEKLAGRLRGAGCAALYVSPIRRARETAQPIAAALGIEPVIEPTLAECHFGEWDGRSFREVGEVDPERFAAWLRGEAPAGGNGESLPQMAARVEAWMAVAAESHPGCAIVAVSHAGPIKAALRHALGVPFDAVYRLQQDLASISVVERASGTWWVRAVNDTAHLLDGAGLPPAGRRPFG